MLIEPQPGDVVTLSSEQEADKGIDLLALLAAMLAEWPLGLALFLVVSLIGTAYTFHLKSQYVASVVILPQNGHGGEANSLASIFSQPSGSLFVGLLRSRSVANEMIDQLHLLDLYHTRSHETARAILAGQSTFIAGADSILTIDVRDVNAQDAARIANGYLEGLDHLNLAMAQDQSREVQHFFSQQLTEERAGLVNAEDALEKFQKQTGFVIPETQSQIGLNAIAQVRQQIVSLQVSLASLLQSETEGNPEVERIRSQITQLQAHEAALENGRNSPVGAAPPAGQLPSTNLDYLRAQREVTYHNNLVNSLANQYESARLSADLNRSAFQIIDRAVVPERKSWPPRKNFILVSLLIAFVCALVGIAAKLVLRRILTDPEHVQSLHLIRKSLARR